jgi:hypothetical protein
LPLRSRESPSPRALRPARRLIVACLLLAVFDRFVPDLQRRVEWRRYEETQAFRFEDSDLFGLGPLVSYLRDHPRGERPRTLFLGNSVLFGYKLAAGRSRRGSRRCARRRRCSMRPSTDLNWGANASSRSGDRYVDRFYVCAARRGASLLTSLIPVDAADRARFRLQRPDPFEPGCSRQDLAHLSRRPAQAGLPARRRGGGSTCVPTPSALRRARRAATALSAAGGARFRWSDRGPRLRRPTSEGRAAAARQVLWGVRGLVAPTGSEPCSCRSAVRAPAPSTDGDLRPNAAFDRTELVSLTIPRH